MAVTESRDTSKEIRGESQAQGTSESALTMGYSLSPSGNNKEDIFIINKA